MFYAVKKGRECNRIYDTWDECKECVTGVSGAIYKKFKDYNDALEYIGETPDTPLSKSKVKNINSAIQSQIEQKVKECIAPVAYVDGCYNDEEHRVGYGVVFVVNNNIIMKDMGRVLDTNTKMRNVLGEITGAIRAVELAMANGYSSLVIAYDYVGIKAWVTGEWSANTPQTIQYSIVMRDYMKKMDIKFVKVKAHAPESEGGSMYNKEADRLAGLACQ